MTDAHARPSARSVTWTVAEEPVGGAPARTLLAAYAQEVGAAIGEPPAALSGPGDDLVPPHGVFLVARLAGEPAGCAGVRLLDAGTAELKRLYVAGTARGTGLGRGLMAAAEEAARRLGAARLVLDTREELVAARRLYERCGYTEVPPYNANAMAGLWYARPLR
ncbi:GNAT family N-acetyltransferase [Streptomyces sp. TRM 70351]|uniref:GNAT family N-acetyltransferase n=1 Tax=Streptomyces sp. TRM 70351 TaxID=3116552 RepID=UPI002E7B65B6|nr:GNAT family N-acetyltransferase [Streptomyces sp. TRM 70351]MEE1928541.1 GNAT family N-acetyltransferase [Streptomyces sp. TRM 70351]